MANVISNRIKLLRDEIVSRKGSFIGNSGKMILSVTYYRAFRKGRSRVQTRAAFLLEQTRLAEVAIYPHWHLAGEHLPMANQWPIATQLDFQNLETQNELRKFNILEDEWPALASALESLNNRCQYAIGENDHAYLQGEAGNPWIPYNEQYGVFMPGGWSENHSIRDYAKVISRGFTGIKAEVEKLLEETAISDADFPLKENFWRAACHICDAGILLGSKYADEALKLAAKATDHEDRKRLEEIARICTKVPSRGASTFFEAVQSLWLCHILTCGEDSINANSLGRIDQILWPYYQADYSAGLLTRDEAVEIMAEFACKLYLEYDVQAITLGGVDNQGKDAVNELSYIILDATEQVDLIRDLSVRLHSGTPAPFLRRSAELIAKGGGIPFIFNDECFIPALTDHGISIEHARDYAPIGCVELTIPGKANPHAVSGWFNALKCLELTLFNGIDPRTGEQLGPKTGDLHEFTSFEELYEAYKRQVCFFAERLVYNCNRGELLQRENGPLPYLSLLTDNCLQRGRDITDGGPLYNYHSICFMGTADTADALIAVKKNHF